MSNPAVLITGGLTGIGRAAAFAFAHDGAKVVVSGRRDAESEALASELRAVGAEAEFIRADVRHDDDVRDLVDRTVARFGRFGRFGRLDVTVSNAGTEGKPRPATDQSAESYAASMHAVEGLTKSVALEAAACGVRVNAVAPGPIDTGMLDRFTDGAEGKAYLASSVAQKRIGNPEEIAAAIVFAASKGASFLTGHILTVDGGKSAG